MEMYQAISPNGHNDETDPNVTKAAEGYEWKTTVEQVENGYLIVEWHIYTPKPPTLIEDKFWLEASSYVLDRSVLTAIITQP